MKKLNVFLLLITVTILTSCSKDDDSSEISAASLVGTWQWTASAENGEEYELDECDLMDTLVFSPDNTASGTYYYFDGTSCAVDVEDDAFTWSLSGDVLTATYTDDGISESYDGTITELTDTTLTIEYIDQDEDEDGNIIEFIYTDTYTRI